MAAPGRGNDTGVGWSLQHCEQLMALRQQRASPQEIQRSSSSSYHDLLPYPPRDSLLEYIEQVAILRQQAIREAILAQSHNNRNISAATFFPPQRSTSTHNALARPSPASAATTANATAAVTDGRCVVAPELLTGLWTREEEMMVLEEAVRRGVPLDEEALRSLLGSSLLLHRHQHEQHQQRQQQIAHNTSSIVDYLQLPQTLQQIRQQYDPYAKECSKQQQQLLQPMNQPRTREDPAFFSWMSARAKRSPIETNDNVTAAMNPTIVSNKKPRLSSSSLAGIESHRNRQTFGEDSGNDKIPSIIRPGESHGESNVSSLSTSASSTTALNSSLSGNNDKNAASVLWGCAFPLPPLLMSTSTTRSSVRTTRVMKIGSLTSYHEEWARLVSSSTGREKAATVTTTATAPDSITDTSTTPTEAATTTKVRAADATAPSTTTIAIEIDGELLCKNIEIFRRKISQGTVPLIVSDSSRSMIQQYKMMKLKQRTRK